MKFYKDPANTVFAYESDGSQDSIIPADQVPITEAEADALRFPAPSLADYQKSTRARIDSDVDAVYYAVIGDRTTEYQQANDDATAFKNAGYLGTVPASVQCWAAAKGWTAQQAADDILTTAANWLGAQQSMRANRLARKQDVSAATTLAAVDSVLTTWATYIAAMRANLGL